MKWTLEQYLQAIRERIDETEDKDYYKDAELIRYLNIAIMEMTMSLQIRGIKTIPAPNSTMVDLDTVFLPTERFASIEQVFIDGELQHFAPLEQAKLENLPYQYGNLLVFPDTITSPVDLYYIKTPLSLVNMQDTTDVHEKYQHVAIDLVIALAKEKDEEWGQGSQARQNFEYGLSKIRQERSGVDAHQGYQSVTMSNYGG